MALLHVFKLLAGNAWNPSLLDRKISLDQFGRTHSNQPLRASQPLWAGYERMTPQ